MSMEEVEDELAFQKTMLATIDDTVQDREDAEAQVKAEIRRLDKLLRSMRDQHKPTQTVSSDSHLYAAPVSHSKDSLSYNVDPFGLPVTRKGTHRPHFLSTQLS